MLLVLSPFGVCVLLGLLVLFLSLELFLFPVDVLSLGFNPVDVLSLGLLSVVLPSVLLVVSLSGLVAEG